MLHKISKRGVKMLTVKSHRIVAIVKENYVFTFSDGSKSIYKKQTDGSLLGRMYDNSEQQYKAVQMYARDNLGDITVQLSLT
jgi:hypothetical protein